ncbi:hypothetical protein F5Y04DRAFT_241679 [Hypomontagnella monticulosa]|nr:hypothetical protein F5Y04DRAFT_241679 [Hypomontagnella monticulosa]
MMDPVSAVGVAAAALQFGEVTFKITKRIAVFTVLRDIPKHAEEPKAFVERLRNQLGLIKSTINRIEEGLTNHTETFQTNELVQLSKYISDLNRNGKELDDLLDGCLPKDGASTPARLVAALKSIAADIKIKSALSSINELLPLLTTFLLTSTVFKAGLLTGSLHGSTIGGRPGQAHDAPSAIYRVSRHEVRHFVNRPALLAEIDRIFDDKSSQSPRVAILQGMGGQGKTQLALRHCRDARSRRKYDCTFWLDASTRASTLRGLEMISEELNANNQVFPDTDARITFVKRKLTAEKLSWLLVFDNYDDPTGFDLRDYIPKGRAGYVLITSRSTHVGRIGPVITVSGMTEDEAMDLLFKQTDSVENATNQTVATQIVRRLGYLPLAVDQAAAYMKAEGLPLKDFLSHYEKSATEVFETVPSLWEYNESIPSEDDKKQNTVAKTVFTTWNLSFTLLGPSTPIGALKITILSILAFFDGNDISEQYFENCCSSKDPSQHPEWMRLFTSEEGRWSSKRFDSVMREFLRLSLITSLNAERKNTDFASVSLHPLVRDWVHLRQENDVHRENFMMFTQLLVATISPCIKEDLCSLLIDFNTPYPKFDCRLSQHVDSWMWAFEHHKPDLNPTLITLEQNGQLATTTAESLLIRCCDRNTGKDIIYGVFQWLWESCCNISDSRMLQAKLRAGVYRSFYLTRMHLYDEAVDKARETLQYWESALGGTNEYNIEILRTCRFTLVMTLRVMGSRKRILEAIDICRSDLGRLEKTEQNLPRRHEYFAYISYFAALLAQDDIRGEAVETMMDETERRGGNNYRKRVWSFNCWREAVHWLLYSRSNHGDQLSQAALEWAVDTFPVDHPSLHDFQAQRARVLAMEGTYSEAENTVREIISDTRQIGYYICTEASAVLGDILLEQGRYEEAYDVYHSIFLHTYSWNLEVAVNCWLLQCAKTAEVFDAGLADAYYTFGLSYLKDIGNWVLAVKLITTRVAFRNPFGTREAMQDNLELLLNGLELYGIKFVYCEGDTPRKHMKETNVTVHLGREQYLRGQKEDEVVRRSLMERIGNWRGFELLVKLPAQLLAMGYTDAAEEAFRLAYTTFEMVTGHDEGNVLNFVGEAFWYTELRFEVDNDAAKVRNMINWAQQQIHSKVERGMDGCEGWWEFQAAGLLELLEPRSTLPSIHRIRRVGSKVSRRLSNIVSRAKFLKLRRSSSSRQDTSLRRGLRLAHNAVTPSVIGNLDGPRILDVSES